MHNVLQTILDDFVRTYPKPGQPPELDLTVGTHDPDRDHSKFRLSDAGRCRLMRYYKRQGKAAGNGMPAHVLLQMQAGNLLHAWIERACYEMGCLVASEAALEDEHRLGHFDMILERPDGTEHILYDIKTITSKKAYYMDRDGKTVDPQHVSQLVSYALMLPDPVDKLRIAYVIRDTMEIRDVPVAMSEHEDDVLDDWARLITAWKAGMEPEPNPKDWECRYCQYASVCPHAR
jgi:CRISPR/Cas system-associated exonuclease Cas4 (RecB family)